VPSRSAVRVGYRHNLPWPVVHGAAVVNFTCFGCAYAMAVFFPFLREGLSFEPWELTSLFSLVGGIYFGVGALSGRLTDRFGARPLVVTGMVVMFVCLLFASQARSPVEFAVAYLVGIGLGVGLTYVPGLAAVQTHAPAHASLAGGLASSGIGVGIMVVPPACALLIERVGWRVTLAAMAALALLGLAGSRPLVKADRVVVAAHSTGAVLRSARFLILYLAYVGVGLVVFVPMANVVPYVASKGLPGHEAALMLALVGSGSILGRLLFGVMGEYVGARRASVQCATLIAVSFLALAVRDSDLVLHLAMLAFGMGYGGAIGLMAPTAAEVMGLRHFGGTLGALNSSLAVGILFGPSLAAILARTTSSYEESYLICAGIAAATAALLHVEGWTRLPLPRAEAVD